MNTIPFAGTTPIRLTRAEQMPRTLGHEDLGRNWQISPLTRTMLDAIESDAHWAFGPQQSTPNPLRRP